MLLFIWNVTGAVIWAIIFFADSHTFDKKCILRPDVIYDMFNVNYFGCAVYTLFINLLCPVISIIYWVIEFLYFIFTVGRKK